MSFKATLFLGNRDYPVRSSEYEFSQPTDANGFPVGKPIGGKMKVQIDSTGNDDFIHDWMVSPQMSADGYIRYYKKDGISKLYDLEFANAYLINQGERYDSTGEALVMNITISAGMLKIGSSIHENPWNSHNPFSDEKGVTSNAIDNSPTVVEVAWLDRSLDKAQAITEASYGQSVSIKATVSNNVGGSAEITITKADGTEFEKGKSQLKFSESIDDNGNIELSSFSIQEDWEELKTEEYDYLIVKVKYEGSFKNSQKLKLLPKAKVLVNFRPHNTYKGEFGFDWLRTGDTGKPGDVWYRDVIGKYNNTTNVFLKDVKEYTKLVNSFDQHQHPTIANDKYIVPVVSLYPSKTAKFSLKVEVKENAKKLEFKFDSKYFKLNHPDVSFKTKGKKTLPDYLEVTCVNEFSQDQYIEVLADGYFAGKIKFLANDKSHRYKANIVFVKVKTTLGPFSKTGKVMGEEATTKKYLKQALIMPSIQSKTMDLSLDNTFNTRFKLVVGGIPQMNDISGIHNYLETKFNQQNPTLSKSYKVFFFDENGGEIKPTGYKGYNGAAESIKCTAVVVYNTRGPSTVTHELLHAMGIEHTFDNNSQFTFEENKTDNIMDYSHNVGIDRISTFKWQWKIAQSNVSKE